MSTDDPRRVKLSIVVYLILTFALSSIFYWLNIHRPHALAGTSILCLMWCPGVSGILTRLLFQGNLRGAGWGWGKWKYQFASYWVPLVYASVVYLPLWAMGYVDFHAKALTYFAGMVHAHLPWAGIVVLYFVILATLGVAGSCISALGEELGWRGFLVPQLAKVTSFGGVGFISGCIWALWHYPLILFGDYHGAGPRWFSVVCFTVLVVSAAFLFAWMRLRSGSLWTGMLLHASHNLFIQAFFDPLTRQTKLTGYVTTEFGAGLAVVLLIIAFVCYRRRNELPSPTSA